MSYLERVPLFFSELFHLLFNQLKNHEACPKLSLCIYSVFKWARIDLFPNYHGDRNNISSTDHTLSLLKDWIIYGIISFRKIPLVKQDGRGLMNIYNYCQRIITHSLIFQNNTNSGRKVCKDRKKKEKKEIVFIVIQKI